MRVNGTGRSNYNKEEISGSGRGMRGYILTYWGFTERENNFSTLGSPQRGLDLLSTPLPIPRLRVGSRSGHKSQVESSHKTIYRTRHIFSLFFPFFCPLFFFFSPFFFFFFLFFFFFFWWPKRGLEPKTKPAHLWVQLGDEWMNEWIILLRSPRRRSGLLVTDNFVWPGILIDTETEHIKSIWKHSTQGTELSRNKAKQTRTARSQTRAFTHVLFIGKIAKT